MTTWSHVTVPPAVKSVAAAEAESVPLLAFAATVMSALAATTANAALPRKRSR